MFCIQLLTYVLKEYVQGVGQRLFISNQHKRASQRLDNSYHSEMNLSYSHRLNEVIPCHEGLSQDKNFVASWTLNPGSFRFEHSNCWKTEGSNQRWSDHVLRSQVEVINAM
jgi:hypothetical protein